MPDDQVPSIVAYRVEQLEKRVAEVFATISAKLDEIANMQSGFITDQALDHQEIEFLKKDYEFYHKELAQFRTALSVQKKEMDTKIEAVSQTVLTIRLTLAEKLAWSAGSGIGIAALVEIITKLMHGV